MTAKIVKSLRPLHAVELARLGSDVSRHGGDIIFCDVTTHASIADLCPNATRVLNGSTLIFARIWLDQYGEFPSRDQVCATFREYLSEAMSPQFGRVNLEDIYVFCDILESTKIDDTHSRVDMAIFYLPIRVQEQSIRDNPEIIIDTTVGISGKQMDEIEILVDRFNRHMSAIAPSVQAYADIHPVARGQMTIKFSIHISYAKEFASTPRRDLEEYYPRYESLANNATFKRVNNIIGKRISRYGIKMIQNQSTTFDLNNDD